MQNKSLLFHILNSGKKPLYTNVVDNVEAGEGVVKADGTPAHLEYSPDGWSDALVKWGRNIKYWGLFREFSNPLTFVKDGAKILRHTMWRTGMEAVLYLSISKLDRTSFPDVYDQWYTGELDFSKYEQQQNGSVEVAITEGGASKYLKAYEGTTYEIPIFTDEYHRNIYLDGFPFTNQLEYTIYEQEIQTSGLVGGVSVSSGAYWILGLGVISREGTSQGIITQDQQLLSALTFPNDNYFINSTDKSIILNVAGTLKFSVNSGDALVGFNIQLRSILGVLGDVYTIQADTQYFDGDVITLPYSFAIPLDPGESAYLVMNTPTSVNDAGKVLFAEGSKMAFDYEVTFTETFCKALTPLRLFEKIVEKMTDGKFGAYSTFLSGMNDILMTSGQAIRRFEDPASVIKTSLNDFFKSFQRYGIGLGIENNKIIIEEMEYFFKNDIAFDLGVVDDVTVTVAEDLIYNTIKIGYANQEYDKVNGKDEANVTQRYSTPLTRIVKELDLVSVYRADPYGIELTRLELFGKDTTDNRADNDTFFINVTSNTFTFPYVNEAGADVFIEAHRLYRPAYTALTGIMHPDEKFNLELSPKDAMNKNGRWFHSFLHLIDDKFIKFLTGEKNSLLSKTLDGVTVTENADMPINLLGDRYFLPYYFNFTTEVPINVQLLLKTNPYSKISFTHKENVYNGYLVDGGVKPAIRDKQKWKLLCAPDNDLTKLI